MMPRLKMLSDKFLNVMEWIEVWTCVKKNGWKVCLNARVSIIWVRFLHILIHMRCGWTVDSALEDRAHTCKIEKHLLASARLFVPPLLIDKSLASDSQLLRSFFRESGLTLTCAGTARVPQLEHMLQNWKDHCTSVKSTKPFRRFWLKWSFFLENVIPPPPPLSPKNTC